MFKNLYLPQVTSDALERVKKLIKSHWEKLSPVLSDRYIYLPMA